MASEDPKAIHPWWVKFAPSSHTAAVVVLTFTAVGLLLTIVLRSQYGVAQASGRVTTTPNLGVGLVEPDEPDVVPYWEAERRFETIETPREGDWLAEFEEPGQTLDEYFASGPNAVTVYRKTLYIAAIGEFPLRSLQLLRKYVQIYFGMRTKILRMQPPNSLQRISEEGVPQWHTADLHYFLFENLPSDAYAVLGVTMTDLYPGEEWEYVFGHARFKERVAVMSGYRFPQPDSARFKERIMRVATHELGHAFGIKHCVHYECSMNGVNSLGESDETPLALCPVDLRKLQTAVGFHPRERYEELAEFYRMHRLYRRAERVEALIDSAENPHIRPGLADAGARLHQH